MSTIKHYLALDLGAESGRAILGTLEKGKITLSEEHRFLTGPEYLPTMYPDRVPDLLGGDNSLVWDFVRFWHEIKKSIRIVSKTVKLEAVGVDTWGVDFSLLDKNGLLLTSPYNYRDDRTNGMMEEAFKRLPKERIYDITGIQFMQLNTLYQMMALSSRGSPLLQIADKFLMVPDLINYWLTGSAVVEFTEATTSQCYDSRKGEWSEEIITAMGFPRHIFPEVVLPGTILGPLRESVSAELLCETTVVATATHDTGAAVSAVPAEVEDFIWISSGTWSIIGMNTLKPVINELSYQNNFTNEGGVDGTFRFSKNMTGLWIVQQCRHQWQTEGKAYSYAELTEMAKKASPLKTFVDPDYKEFSQPGNMVEKVKKYCKITGQPVPENEGEVIRAVLQGLALRYRYVIEKLEEISGRKTSTIHIVGGGTKNLLLNQFTADVLGRKVVVGPIEATATGNLIAQAIAMGDIASWQEGASVIRSSFKISTFMPGDKTPWNAAYESFKNNFKKADLAF